MHDLQTRKKFYFLCEKWLAIDKDDFKIERCLILSTQHDKVKLKYWFSKEVKNNFCDDHLWFSILARPVQSSFTRLDRLTCCFVLLSMSMLLNIMYYGILDNTSNEEAFKVGPFLNFTIQQISVDLLSNVFLILPSLFLVQLFRRIKRRRTRLDKIKQIFKQKNKNDPKKMFEKKFPWWFKIFAYILSILFASVSVFFVIVKGIQFGDDKVTKWLTSLIVYFLCSIFLTQPIQVTS